MKIIHTSDWHIGKQLQKVDFIEDMSLFFTWLIEYIQEEKIDLLLMSGDLFDQANPSQAALKQYYEVLKKLIPLKCKVIITGGNHDSPLVLNAPKELLNLLDISIIGGKPDEISELFILVEKGDEKVVIAAVPFLRDKDIRNAAPGESYSDKVEQLKVGLENYFKTVNTHYKENFNGIPYILMGHLYAAGASTSDSEREIQIGNQAGVESAVFGNEADYIALGHIHKPQILGGKENIRYCGSPIPMSFSEKNDAKKVILINTENKNFAIHPIELPSFRKLIRFEGTFEEVFTKINDYKSESPLCDLAEIIIKEENENSETIRQVEELLSNDSIKNLQILKSKIEFKTTIKGSSDIMEFGEEISNYSPIQLFEKRLALDPSIENTKEYMDAFREILEGIHSKIV